MRVDRLQRIRKHLGNSLKMLLQYLTCNILYIGNARIKFFFYPLTDVGNTVFATFQSHLIRIVSTLHGINTVHSM